MLRSLSVSLLASLVLVAACSVGAPPTPSPAPPTSAPTAAPSAAPATSPSAAPTAAATASGVPYCDPDYYECDRYTPSPQAGDELLIGLSQDGSYLVDPAGLSLYIFDNDEPNVSNCSGGCAGAWPALALADEQAPVGAEGVTGELTAFERPDGIFQVAYNGQPLYYFSGDSAPGDTTGDGVNGVWHLATP
jgi:predicted lipoprotein with Yx(FWY)xxD motif